MIKRFLYIQVSVYLEHGEQTLPETIEVRAIFLLFIVIKFTTKNLHAQQCKYHNKQEEQ